MSFQAPEETSSLAAASAADGPGPGSVEVRTVVEIRPVAPRAPAQIPENEAEFWSLLSRDGHVIFRSDEVGVLNTPVPTRQNDHHAP